MLDRMTSTCAVLPRELLLGSGGKAVSSCEMLSEGLRSDVD